MARKSEVRMGEGSLVLIVIAVIVAVVGSQAGWFSTADADPAPVTTPTGTPLSVVPAIEKTKIYVSGFDMADFDGEGQNNRVAGTADLIKSGTVLETVTTLTTTGAASTSEFNGGDKITALIDASGYYANAVSADITETLQPFEAYIKDAATPDVYIEDDSGDLLVNITLDTNDVSKTHTLVIERPGDDTYYQLCGVAADYDDEKVEVRVKDLSGSYVEGENDLDDKYDALDAEGFDFVWDYEQEIKNFDAIEIDFVVGTAKDVNPGELNITMTVFDCEWNLQSGELVYENEDASDNDVGITNINETINIF
jgi:hypothetical protein